MHGGLDMTAVTIAQSQARSRFMAVLAASIGNALEWFDFVIYGFLARDDLQAALPGRRSDRSLCCSRFGTFGVTFVMRPVGSIVLGAYADSAGRKAPLLTDVDDADAVRHAVDRRVADLRAHIGIWDPLLIIVARLLQGFAAGGEFGSATALLAEQDPKRRGFFASWQLQAKASRPYSRPALVSR